MHVDEDGLTHRPIQTCFEWKLRVAIEVYVFHSFSIEPSHVKKKKKTIPRGLRREVPSLDDDAWLSFPSGKQRHGHALLWMMIERERLSFQHQKCQQQDCLHYSTIQRYPRDTVVFYKSKLV